jgi:hypothetical protein
MCVSFKSPLHEFLFGIQKGTVYESPHVASVDFRFINFETAHLAMMVDQKKHKTGKRKRKFVYETVCSMYD